MRESRPGGRAWLAAVAAVVCGALGIIAARAAIPGRDLDKPAWELLEHEAQIKAGRVMEGCAGLERDLRSLGRAEAEPIVTDLDALTAACASASAPASAPVSVSAPVSASASVSVSAPASAPASARPTSAAP